MTRTNKTALTLAAAFAIAMGGFSLNVPAEAGTLVLKKGSGETPTHTAPGNKTNGSGGTSRGQIGPLDPDKFIANCHAAGGGASTDEDGFDQCTDANGNTIPVPWEE